MREADPVNNVELRRDRHGHESVVFSFPYVREVVDAVRAIPGRRFDWDAKEWWALQADGTAPYVKGVIERHDWLKVAPEVEAWLAEAVTGWVGRVGAGKLGGAGSFALETISGELPEELAALADARGGRLWLPFNAEVAEALLRDEGRALRRARRALRPAAAGRARAGAGHAVADRERGGAALKLDVNWDPETIPAFLELPACEAHGRSLPVDPYLLEPLEHYLRRFGVEVGANAADVLERLRAEHDRAIVDVRRSRAHDGPALEVEASLGGELRPFQRAGVAYALKARRTFLADEQGLGKTVQALAALEADGAYPAVVICPASLKLNWQRETERWLPRALDHGRVRHRRHPEARRHHDPQLRHRPRPPRAAVAGAAEGARARRVPLRQEPARQAHEGGAPPRRRDAGGRAAARADRHAGDEPPRRADRPAAGARPARGVRERARASRAASRAWARRSASTGTCAARASCGGSRPTCCRSSRASARSSCRWRSTTSASTGSPSRT